jgi:hypothetical protein
LGSLPTMPPLGGDAGGDSPSTAARGPGGSVYPTPAPQVAYVIKPRPRWQALRTLASVFKICAWMSGGLGVIGALTTLASGNQFGSGGTTAGLFLGMVELLGAGVGFLGLYGYGELMLLLISIEENTRKL